MMRRNAAPVKCFGLECCKGLAALRLSKLTWESLDLTPEGLQRICDQVSSEFPDVDIAQLTSELADYGEKIVVVGD